MIRWVVESINGKIKRFELFNKMFSSSQIPVVNEYIQIICAILNRFRGPIITNYNGEEDLAKKVLERCKQENKLLKSIETNQLNKSKLNYVKLCDSNINDFPRMNYADLQEITMGCYQIKQDKSYIMEHKSEKSGYEILCHKIQSGIVMCIIQSRHTSAKKYRCWIKYNNQKILGYYCECKVGARVVGCCSHIASIISYLSYFKYLKLKPGYDKIKNSLMDSEKENIDIEIDDI